MPLPITSIASGRRRPEPRSTDYPAGLVVAILLIAGGVVALIVSVSDNRLHSWPLVLVALGVLRVGTAAVDERAEGWWLILTGWSLLCASAAQTAAPLAVVAAGVAAFLRVTRTAGRPEESADVR